MARPASFDVQIDSEKQEWPQEYREQSRCHSGENSGGDVVVGHCDDDTNDHIDRAEKAEVVTFEHLPMFSSLPRDVLRNYAAGR